MKFDTQQFPLISRTTSFNFIDTRLTEQEIKSRHRRETAKHLVLAVALLVAFIAVASFAAVHGLR